MANLTLLNLSSRSEPVEQHTRGGLTTLNLKSSPSFREGDFIPQSEFSLVNLPGQFFRRGKLTMKEALAHELAFRCLAFKALVVQDVVPIVEKYTKKWEPDHMNPALPVLYLPPSYTPPAREYGSQWFERQPDEVKAGMMSNVAFAAYKRGDVTLKDFVGVKRSRVWGEMRYERSFKDALKVAQKRGTTAALMQEKKLLKLMRAKEDEIRAQRFESAFFWDGRGKLLFSRDGELTRVKFADEERALLQGSVSTHNHPLGWNYSERDPRRAGNSFSENDVRAACYFSLSILRIVTPQVRYMMKPPPEGWNGAYWENTLRPAYRRIYQQTEAEFMAKVKARQMLSSVAGTTFIHEVWSRVAARLGLNYAREEF